MKKSWKQVVVLAVTGSLLGAGAVPSYAAFVDSGPGAAAVTQTESDPDIEVRDGITYRTAHFTGIDANYRMGAGDQITNVGFALQGLEGDVAFDAAVNHGGWQPWTLSGGRSGGAEESTYLEGVRLYPRGGLEKSFDIYYACITAQKGKLGYAKNGEKAGNLSGGDHVVNLDIVLVPKGGQAPESTGPAYYSPYANRVVNENGVLLYTDPNGNNYMGWLEDGDDRYYVKDNQMLTGWQYIDGYKYYFGADGKLVQDLDPVIGIQSSYQIKINKEMSHLTVYAKDGENGYIMPVKTMLTTVGDDTPIGTFRTPEKHRWRLMVNGAYTQYDTRIKPGAGFLIHSVIFETENNRTLWVDTFNQLGAQRSLGCVRVTTGNAKWIYDNCPLGTEIIIYNGQDKSPLPVPEQIPIPQWQNWDPTDPAV